MSGGRKKLGVGGEALQHLRPPAELQPLQFPNAPVPKQVQSNSWTFAQPHALPGMLLMATIIVPILQTGNEGDTPALRLWSAANSSASPK